jgi:AraC-like DNA-binding protein
MGQAFIKYLPVNVQAVAWQMYCTNAGFVSVPEKTPYPPFADAHPISYSRSVTTRRVLNEFQILYITSGSGSFRSETIPSVPIRTGDVFFLFPNVWHAYSPDFDTGWDEHWIGFNGRYPQTLLKEGFLSPDNPVVHVGAQQRLVALMSDIMDIARAERPGFQLRLGAAVMQILAEVLTAAYQSEQETGVDLLIKKAKYFMEEHIYGVLPVGEMLSELGVSASTLARAFHNYTGLSQHQYFLQMKISKAKVLLEEKDKSIKEVALLLGFEDQYYFSRFFRNRTGMSPSDWVKRSSIPPAQQGRRESEGGTR